MDLGSLKRSQGNYSNSLSLKRAIVHPFCISWRESIERRRETKGSRFLASVQMSILCHCVCRSAFPFHFVSVFQFSLSLNLGFLSLWSCLWFLSCPWLLVLYSPVGSADVLSFCLLFKSRFWKGEEERGNNRASKTDAAVQWRLWILCCGRI